jgi:hypothetical protein
VGYTRREQRIPQGVTKHKDNRSGLERPAIEGDSPVGEILMSPGSVFPSTTAHVKGRGKLGGPPSKAKYYQPTDSE